MNEQNKGAAQVFRILKTEKYNKEEDKLETGLLYDFPVSIHLERNH